MRTVGTFGGIINAQDKGLGKVFFFFFNYIFCWIGHEMTEKWGEVVLKRGTQDKAELAALGNKRTGL